MTQPEPVDWDAIAKDLGLRSKKELIDNTLAGAFMLWRIVHHARRGNTAKVVMWTFFAGNQHRSIEQMRMQKKMDDRLAKYKSKEKTT